MLKTCAEEPFYIQGKIYLSSKKKYPSLLEPSKEELIMSININAKNQRKSKEMPKNVRQLKILDISS